MRHITVLLLLSTLSALNAQSQQYPWYPPPSTSTYNPWASQSPSSGLYPPPSPSAWGANPWGTQSPSSNSWGAPPAANPWGAPPPPANPWGAPAPATNPWSSNSWGSPYSGWGNYPPPAAAPAPGVSVFYTPPSPSYTPPSVSPYAPTYSNQGTGTDNRLKGWNILGRQTPISVNPGVDVYSGSSLVVSAADAGGQIRGTVCPPSSSSSATWTSLAANHVPPINGVATTISGGNVFTTFCGNDGLLYTAQNSLGGTTINSPGVISSPGMNADGMSALCVDTPATVNVNGQVYGFDRYSAPTGAEGLGVFTVTPASPPPSPVITPGVVTSAPSSIQYGPTATTYTDNTGQVHILVAVVLYGGQMQYADTTVASTQTLTVAALQAMRFTSSSLTCHGPPVAVSLGTSAQIYCVGGLPYPGCLLMSTIQNGGEVSAQYYTDKYSYFPLDFSAGYVNPNVNLVARSDTGFLYTKALDSTKWSSLYM